MVLKYQDKELDFINKRMEANWRVALSYAA